MKNTSISLALLILAVFTPALAGLKPGITPSPERARVVIQPKSLPAGTAGTPYMAQLSGSGGVPPYHFSLASGDLPVGVSFSSGGKVSGEPTAAGAYTMTVRITDSEGKSNTGPYTIHISAPVIAIPTSLPGGKVGEPYAQSLAAKGGKSPYIYVITGGALPVGMTLSSSGALKGTPQSSGNYYLMVTATDANKFTGSVNAEMKIAAAELVLSPTALPEGKVGIQYMQQFLVSGGVKPYKFSATGKLPAGVTVDAKGMVSGTPTKKGTYKFNVEATDQSGSVVSAKLVLKIKK